MLFAIVPLILLFNALPVPLDAQAELFDSEIEDNSEWQLHADPDLGYNVKFPAKWQISMRPPLPDLVGDTSFISPRPAQGYVSTHFRGVPVYYTVSIGQRSAAVPQGMSLRRWTQLHICNTRISAGSYSADLKPWGASWPVGSEELVYVIGDSMQYIQFKRGEVVWYVMANYGNEEPEKTQIFRAIAGSFQFEPDAPMTYEEIYDHSPGELWFPEGVEKGGLRRSEVRGLLFEVRINKQKVGGR